MNIHWPATRDNNYVAWYVIGWRAVWSPFWYAGIAIATFGRLMGFGVNEAISFWREMN